MFLRRLAALLLAAAPLPACAQQQPRTQDADPALWVVKDRDTTVYLFGTIHVLKPGLTWFDEAVKAAFDKGMEKMPQNCSRYDNVTRRTTYHRHRRSPEDMQGKSEGSASPVVKRRSARLSQLGHS